MKTQWYVCLGLTILVSLLFVVSLSGCNKASQDAAGKAFVDASIKVLQDPNSVAYQKLMALYAKDPELALIADCFLHCNFNDPNNVAGCTTMATTILADKFVMKATKK